MLLLVTLGIESIHFCCELLNVPARSLIHVASLALLIGGLPRRAVQFSTNAARGLTEGVVRRDRRELSVKIRRR